MLFWFAVEVSSAKAAWIIICESCHQDFGLGPGWPRLRTLHLLRELFYCFLKNLAWLWNNPPKGCGKYIFCSCYLRHSQGFISAGMLHMQDGYPHLTVKAWNGQVLLVFLDRCLTALVAAGAQDQEIQLAHFATRAMSCWFDRLARFPRYLSQAQGTEVSNFGFRFLRLYRQLAILAVLRGVARWRLLPKVHPFRHMNEDMRDRLYNYRYCHTFKDEDNVGVCKKLAERVAKGDLMEYRIMTRFLLRVGSWVPWIAYII